MAAGISQFKHSPSDKRGLGLTFLGMQDASVSNNVATYKGYVTREEFDSVIGELRAEIKRMKEPWYKRLWMWIRKQ